MSGPVAFRKDRNPAVQKLQVERLVGFVAFCVIFYSIISHWKASERILEHRIAIPEQKCVSNTDQDTRIHANGSTFNMTFSQKGSGLHGNPLKKSVSQKRSKRSPNLFQAVRKSIQKVKNSPLSSLGNGYSRHHQNPSSLDNGKAGSGKLPAFRDDRSFDGMYGRNEKTMAQNTKSQDLPIGGPSQHINSLMSESNRQAPKSIPKFADLLHGKNLVSNKMGEGNGERNGFWNGRVKGSSQDAMKQKLQTKDGFIVARKAIHDRFTASHAGQHFSSRLDSFRWVVYVFGLLACVLITFMAKQVVGQVYGLFWPPK